MNNIQIERTGMRSGGTRPKRLIDHKDIQIWDVPVDFYSHREEPLPTAEQLAAALNYTGQDDLPSIGGSAFCCCFDSSQLRNAGDVIVMRFVVVTSVGTGRGDLQSQATMRHLIRNRVRLCWNRRLRSMGYVGKCSARVGEILKFPLSEMPRIVNLANLGIRMIGERRNSPEAIRPGGTSKEARMDAAKEIVSSSDLNVFGPFDPAKN